MEGYLVSLIILTATFALFSLGLNLQLGYTGLINFGHVAFMAVGAYTTVLLSLNGVPLVIAALIGGILAALLGLVLGISTLRLREDYLAIVTIGTSEVIRLIALNEEWLTRGSFGVGSFPLPLEALTRPTLFSKLGMIALWISVFIAAGWQGWKWLRREAARLGHPGGSRASIVVNLCGGGAVAILGLVLCWFGATALYNYSYKAGLMLLVVSALALVYRGLEVLVTSPWGRVLKAIREDEDVARALGKNVFSYKLQSLMLGGAIAGIAGSFYAWNLATIYPQNFDPQITFDALIIVVLGGAGSNVGTVIGAIMYWAYYSLTRFLPDLLSLLHQVIPVLPPSIDDTHLGAVRAMIIGGLLIALMMTRPQGMLGKKEELTLGR